MTDLQKKAARTAIAYRLGIPEWWLQVVFAIESGDNPAAVNPYTGATGLIQFMPTTAKELGFTTDQIKLMNYEEQLFLVYRYLNRYKPKSLVDTYLSIFYPYAVGKPQSYIIGSERNAQKAIFNQNPGFKNQDNARRGYYTKQDITEYVRNKAKNLGYSVFEQFLSNLDMKIDRLFK